MCHQVKFLKMDLGSRVSRTSVNLHEIVGIRLDDINKHTQRHMHEHIGKRAKMQRTMRAKRVGIK